MLKKTKIAGAVLSAAMLVGLAACGNNGSSGSSDGSADLHMMIWDEAQKKGMDDMVAAFTAKNPKIKVTVDVVPYDQYWNKLETTAKANTMPDIFWQAPEFVPKYATSGKVVDLTDYLEKDGVDLGNYPEGVVKALSDTDGHIWAMPKDYSTVGLWYNKGLFDAAGVAYPTPDWTWDDLTNAATKLTDKSKGQYGIVADNDGNFYESFLFESGAQVLTNADGSKATMDSPEAISALNYAYSFIKNGYSPTIAEQSSTKPDDWFTSGKAAMIFNGSWMPATYVEAMKTNGQKFDVSVLPKGPKGTTANNSNGLGFGVAKNTKNLDACIKLVEFLGDKEAQEIQAKDKAAIPAYNGTATALVEAWPEINFQAFVDSAPYGTNPNFSAPAWANLRSIEQDGVANILAGKVSVEDGLKQMNKDLQAAIDDFGE